MHFVNTIYGKNNCSEMWVKIKKLSDHTKYNTISDNISYISIFF